MDSLWLWEDCFLESGIACAAAALAWTSRLNVGVGLLPVPLRNVALTAMEAATLDRLFPGRAMIGIGHGVQDWMGQVGARAASPLTLLREYTDALKALLAGERVTLRPVREADRGRTGLAAHRTDAGLRGRARHEDAGSRGRGR